MPISAMASRSMLDAFRKVGPRSEILFDVAIDMRCLDRNARGAERSTLTCLPLRNDVSFERGSMCSIGSHVSPRKL